MSAPDCSTSPQPAEESPVEAILEAPAVSPEVVIAKLAALPKLQYDKVRSEEAKNLGIRTSTLDDAVGAARKGEAEGDTPFAVVEPWPSPVDGAELLTTLVSTVRRFIICELETAQAVALWVTMTWFMDVVDVAPLAVITAPEKRCGKSMLLSLMSKLVYRALISSSISPAALYRSIDAWKPTLLIDETDACLKDNEELRGLINSGHTRDSAYVIRCEGDNHEPKMYSTWGAKVLSGIGHVADTLMDRSIKLDLRRKLPHENVERIRHSERDLFNNLSSKLARFAEDNRETVCMARPDLPHSLNDRAQDNWEPLLAIAMVAGGDWFKIGTAAALKLSGGESLSLSVGTELLTDIQEIFEQRGIDRISTADLIKYLCADEEKSWATFNKGFQIKPKQIATKLRGYDIISNTIRFSSGPNAKGYKLDQFRDAFARYHAEPSMPDTPHPSVTTLQPAPATVLGVTGKANVTSQADFMTQTLQAPHSRDVTLQGLHNGTENAKVTPITATGATCNGVTDRAPLQTNNSINLADAIIDLTNVEFTVCG